MLLVFTVKLASILHLTVEHFLKDYKTDLLLLLCSSFALHSKHYLYTVYMYALLQFMHVILMSCGWYWQNSAMKNCLLYVLHLNAVRFTVNNACVLCIIALSNFVCK